MTIHDQLVAIVTDHGVNPDHLREVWAERAAIREYLGGLERPAAEQAAVGDAREILEGPAPVAEEITP